jgi:peptide/nickel transport system permease protein
MRFLIRRFAHGLFLLLGVSALSFLLVQLAPGDYFEQMALNPQISPQTVATLRARYGLDRPLPLQYVRWVRSVLAGDLGFSFAYNSPVALLLRPRVENTLILAVPAALLAWLIALPVGVWSAARRGGWGDRLCAAGSSALLAVPDLLMALALLFVAVRTGYFPTGGMSSAGFSDSNPWQRIGDIGFHMILPVTALVLGTLPMLVRHVRAALIDVMDAPFIRTAQAHGISRRRILWRHALPAAANPLITLFGVSVGTLLSASLLIEVIMSWPGLGPMVLEAVLSRDVYLVIGAVMVSTAFLVTGSLFADLLLYASDPRIRRK